MPGLAVSWLYYQPAARLIAPVYLRRVDKSRTGNYPARVDRSERPSVLFLRRKEIQKLAVVNPWAWQYFGIINRQPAKFEMRVPASVIGSAVLRTLLGTNPVDARVAISALHAYG